MDVYHYSPLTKEYVGSTPADPDPEEPGRFLIPGFATTIPPKALNVGFANVFDTTSKTWLTVQDHRGETWYDITGKETEIAGLGDPADQGLLKTPPPPPPPSTDPKDYILNRIQFDYMIEVLGLSAQINTALDAMPSSTPEEQKTKILARLLYEKGQEFHREHPFFTTLAAAIGLNNAQIDAAWMNAKDVTW